jgi:hypothetical protein
MFLAVKGADIEVRLAVDNPVRPQSALRMRWKVAWSHRQTCAQRRLRGEHLTAAEIGVLVHLVNENSIVYDDSCIESGDSPMAAKRKDWQALVKGLLKAELKRRDLSYADLAAKLATIGVKDSERNISNKMSRGSFTAVFFVQCMEAIGCTTIHLTQS